MVNLFCRNRFNINLSNLSVDLSLNNLALPPPKAFLSMLYRLPDVQIPGDPVLQTPHLPVCPTVNALVVLEAVLNPNSDVQPFVDQVLMLARLMVSVLLPVLCAPWSKLSWYWRQSSNLMVMHSLMSTRSLRWLGDSDCECICLPVLFILGHAYSS